MPHKSNIEVPAEIWGNILAYLSSEDLSRASVVSRNWQLLVFPHLYRLVRLSRGSHIQQVRQQISKERRPELSVVHHMRTVIAGTTIKRWGNRSTILIKEEDMPNLHEILIAATQLERFAWYLPFLPLTETTRILQTRCSNLHSIECFLGHQGWDDLDRYHNIFAFHDLRYFSLDAPRPSRLRHEYSQKLAPLLRACPNLEVLSIRISGTNVSGSSWSLNAILALLENTTLSCLHTLRVHGELDENWDGFFSLPEMSPLRGFLLRHPTLRTITFGGNYRKQDVRCSPESVETFFPSLRDFTAAPPLCGAVIHSLLAAQIRSFSITDIREDQMDLIPQAFRLMPELRVFSARFGFGGGSARTIAEKHVTVYHPRLEALELEPKVHDFNQFLSALSLFPNLRALSINIDVPRLAKAHEWPGYVQTLADKCTKLQRVSESYRATPRDYWVVDRSIGGAVRTIQVPAIGKEGEGKEYSSAFE